MYGAMREHAPSSTRLTGLVSAAALTLAAGYALANGMGVNIAKFLPEPLIYVSLPEREETDFPQPTLTDIETPADVTFDVPRPLVEVDIYIAEQPPIIGSLDAPPRDPPVRTPGAAVTPPKSPVLTAAKMLPTAPPAYPPSAIRRNAEGVSLVDVCIDARGKVSAASLTQSSGHAELDNAALKWVRTTRFTPAKTDGTPTAVCGHAVAYEWKLER